MTTNAITIEAATLLAKGVPRDEVRDDVFIALVFESKKGSDDELRKLTEGIVAEAEKLNLSRRPS